MHLLYNLCYGWMGGCMARNAGFGGWRKSQPIEIQPFRLPQVEESRENLNLAFETFLHYVRYK
jgi:hypothetical protein